VHYRDKLSFGDESYGVRIFSASVTVKNTPIRSNTFEAIIVVKDTLGNVIDPTSKQNRTEEFTLSTGSYTFELSRGESTAKTGFCVVKIGNEKYHTQQLNELVSSARSASDTVSFILTVTEDVSVFVTSHIGTSSFYNYDNVVENDYYIVNSVPLKVIITSAALPPQTNDENSSEPAEPIVTEPIETTPDQTEGYDGSSEYIHIVSAGENLAKIAQKYGVDLGKLMAYNTQITNYNYILPGDEVKIPPTSWDIPQDQVETAPEGDEPADNEPADDDSNGIEE